MLLALALVGCAGPPSADVSEAELLAFREVIQTGGLTDADRAVIRMARIELVGECMRERGWRYDVAASPGTDVELPPYSSSGSWRWDDVDLASRVGFGYAGLDLTNELADGSETAVTEYDRYVDSLVGEERERYYRDLNGSVDALVTVRFGDVEMTAATDGCRAAADTELFGSVEASGERVAVSNELRPTLRQEVEDSREVKGTMRRWAACMDDRGLDFDHPDDAAEAAGERLRQAPDDPAARAFEIELAVATAECNREVGLRAVGEQVELEVLADFHARYADNVVAMRQVNELALERAASVVGT